MGLPDRGSEIAREGIILRKKSLLLATVLSIPAFLGAGSPKMLVSWKDPILRIPVTS